MNRPRAEKKGDVFILTVRSTELSYTDLPRSKPKKTTQSSKKPKRTPKKTNRKKSNSGRTVKKQKRA